MGTQTAQEQCFEVKKKKKKKKKKKWRIDATKEYSGFVLVLGFVQRGKRGTRTKEYFE